jgi:hypothetical protein
MIGSSCINHHHMPGASDAVCNLHTIQSHCVLRCLLRFCCLHWLITQPLLLLQLLLVFSLLLLLLLLSTASV